MRTSKRDTIIDAALDVIASDGVSGLTFEAVAERSALTRGGIVYHFRTREALIEGIAERLVAGWQAELLTALGKPREEATTAERVGALVRSAFEDTIRPGELVFLSSGLEAAARANQAWDRFCDEWTGPREELTAGQRVAIMAADGYWAGGGSDGPREADGDPAVVALVLRLAAGEGIA